MHIKSGILHFFEGPKGGRDYQVDTVLMHRCAELSCSAEVPRDLFG